MRRLHIVAAALFGLAMHGRAHADTLCIIVRDAQSGRVLVERGDCRTRVTPASTFKVPLSVMGFDSGVLGDAHTPLLPYEAGYVDWGGEAWRQPTDPTRWLKYSVVWYSQIVAHAIGEARLTAYARAYGFGNADFSGDPGKDNGLDRAWIASSLQVSPYEQTEFLCKLVMRALPASAHAMAQTNEIVEISPADDGWQLHGKTGTAYPRDGGGVPDQGRGYGWYVGWAVKGDRTLVFAQLDRDRHADAIPTGLRTRATFLQAWTGLAEGLR